MVFVFAFAEAIRGSKRWIELGPIQFQPSEFGKVLFVLAIAGFLVERQRQIGRLRDGRHGHRARRRADAPRLPAARPRHGARLRRRAVGCPVPRRRPLAPPRRCSPGVAATLVAGILWFLPAAGIEVLKPYQTARLTGFTNPDSDPSGLTYNVNQSITAVGAGGLEGRGVTEASQTTLRLPARARDRLRVRVVRRAARLLRRGDPAAALPARRVARAPRGDGRRRPLRRRRRGRDRVRLPLPGVRQRRHDDGHRTRDGHPAAVRDRRRLVDGREPRRDRDPAGDPRPRPARPTSCADERLRHRPARRARPRARRARGGRPRRGRCSSPACSPHSSRASSRPEATRARPHRAATRPRRRALVRVVAGAATPGGRARSCGPRRARSSRSSSCRRDRRRCGSRTSSPPTSSSARPGSGFPVDEIAEALARVLGPAGPALAAGAPRSPRAGRAPPSSAMQLWPRRARRAHPRDGPQLPVLALAQARMLSDLSTSRGGTPRPRRPLAPLPRRSRRSSPRRSPSASVTRSLVRRLPVRNRLARRRRRGASPRSPSQRSRDAARLRPVRVLGSQPTTVLRDGGFGVPDTELAEELLQIEEADAWFEYLESTRGQNEGRYQELEPWAWATPPPAPEGGTRPPRPAAARSGLSIATEARSGGVTDSLAAGSWPHLSTSNAARGAPLLRTCARARLHEETRFLPWFRFRRRKDEQPAAEAVTALEDAPAPAEAPRPGR